MNDGADSHLATSPDAVTVTNGHGTAKHIDAGLLGLNPDLTTSYPSQSLNFLRKLKNEGTRDVLAEEAQRVPQAKFKMRVVIVGAGLGGLTTAIALARRGHTVTVLEQAKTLGEVGAGIQIPSNTSRLLQRWGLFKSLEKLAVKPTSINFRRWENGAVIGHTRLQPEFQDNFGAPYYVAHRAHLHVALSERAAELGVTVRLDSKVEEFDNQYAVVTLEDGTVVGGDLVVAADGINSKARSMLHPESAAGASFNSFAAYRATVDTEKIRADPSISWILDTPNLNVWIGENRHVMTYTMAAGKSFNMVLSHIDHSDPATWKREDVLDDMKREFAGWDVQLVKIVSLVEKTLKWPLRSGVRLHSWVNSTSRLVIIGDAAHAMLPYMSQGAAMAMEDGAALSYVLSQISSLEELPFALRTFQEERVKRSGEMQEASTVNGLIWHFPDGPEQAARDEGMRPEVENRPFTSSPNQWSDPVTQAWAYGYDAEEAMRERWNKAISGLIINSS